MKYNQEPIGGTVAAFLKASGLQSEYQAFKIRKRWREIAGTAINDQTTDVYYGKKILHVYILSAPLRQQLFIYKEQYLKILQEEFGENIVTAIQIH